MHFAPWRTLRGRLVVTALLVELLMLGMLVGNSLRLLRESMGAQAERQAEQISPVLVAALVAPLAQFDYATVQAVIDESQAIRGINYVAVLDAGGRQVAVSGWPAGSPLPDPDPRLDLAEEPPRYDVVRPINLAGQHLGTLRFGLDLSHIVQARGELLSQGVAIAAGEMLLSAGLLSLLGLLITRQLSRLTRASLQVAQGDFAIEPVPEGRDDVGRLGAAFNAMSDAIADRVAQLTRANEQTVRMAASLHERNLQLDAILALSPDGFVAFDSSGVVRLVSPAFPGLSGLAEDQVVGVDETRFSALLSAACRPGQVFPGVVAMQAAQQQAGERPLRQLITLAATGRELEVSLRESGSGEVARLLFFRDVPHERAVDRMKSEFLSHAAHELRTPMASIYGFAELLRMRPMNETRRSEVLAIIHRQAGAMTQIIDELLDLARIDDRRGQDFEFTEVDAGALAREVAEGFGLPEGREPPRLQLPDSPRRVRADPAKLAQALRNLLSNAYKYSPGGGEVRLSIIDGNDGQVGLQVVDHGLGMSAEQVARVFERFYRVDHSGAIPGTGLGMSIVKELMEIQGGRVEVSSTPAVGTTATLWLPRLT
ncbi:MAG: HAMP domain-containing protein [Burkholderiales bacterium]|nr:HAMP domain-containing protein [Burkholderiales bacterium]